ncbi:cytochrome P450 [Xylariaceae sp. FL0255]|nr:cytochrome P450 [Xylariaceae sp. FL0255]
MKDTPVSLPIANFSRMKPRGLGERLRLRSIPNTRLIRAFDGINNSFTTLETHTHQIFLKRAHDIVRIHKTDDWVELGHITEITIEMAVNEFRAERPYLPMAPLTRIVSFAVMLKVLFNITPCSIEISDVQNATEAINRLWVQSKDKHTVPSPFDKTLLNNALARLIPEQLTLDKNDNHPLNLLIPGYETLGRVVLLTFMATAYRQRDSETREMVQDAVEKVPQCFGDASDNAAETQARMIAKEGLRLYPPTKRIHRSVSVSNNDERKVLAADIEACHRDREIWGPDAHEFRPARFRGWPAGPSLATATEKKLCHIGSAELSPAELKHLAYMPFSIGKHQCPAINGFGERMITLLVVKLIKRFGTKETGLQIHLGNTELEKNPEDLLPSGRADLETLVLQLNEEGGVRERVHEGVNMQNFEL